MGKAGGAKAAVNYGSRARNVWNCRVCGPRNRNRHEDARRCWSKPNMRPMHSTANKEKLTKLLPIGVTKVPKELWPKAWEAVARTA